jgi:hypothetical protein
MTTTTRRPAPTPAIPADWCPGRPGVERVARLLLNRERPDLRYDLTDPRDVLTALAHRWPGNQLPDIVASRDRLLAEETARCAAVAGLYAEVLRLAELELGEAS